jgi:hypothetical protein
MSASSASRRRADEQPDLTPGLIPWPEPISEVGMYGIAGGFVRLVEPHTEADPNILLLAFLVYAGHASSAPDSAWAVEKFQMNNSAKNAPAGQKERARVRDGNAHR